jgi:hypothetical protein
MNVCYLCGQKASARANGTHWLCETHAMAMAVEVLKQGGGVIMASSGKPQYMIMPEIMNLKAGAQSLN